MRGAGNFSGNLTPKHPQLNSVPSSETPFISYRADRAIINVPYMYERHHCD